jgi:hypothetical protein
VGFPETFARTKNGLFYPIRDVNEFTGPTSVCKLKGVQLIYAKSISDKHPESAEPQLVGYSFLPEWKEADAMSFVKGYSEPTRKMWLYQVDLKEKGLEVTEIVNEQAPILEFEKAIDFGEKDVTSIASYRVVGEKKIDEEPAAVVPPEKEPEPVVCPQTPAEPKAALAIEVKIDEMIPTFIQCFNSVITEIKTLVSKVDEVLTKKPIDLQNPPCDNKTNGGTGQSIDPPDNATPNGDDDSIEFGENLLTPEGKTQDSEPDQIEIDVADISEINAMAQSAGGAVAETLGKHMMEALKQSGRID